MIYTDLHNIGRYRGLNANLDKAIDFLQKKDLSVIADGRYEIDGDKVYAFVSTNELKDCSVAAYERHQLYADLQLILCGRELILTVGPESLASVDEIQGDFQKCYPEENAIVREFILESNTLLILFPEDIHAPGLYPSSNTCNSNIDNISEDKLIPSAKKLVIKFLI